MVLDSLISSKTPCFFYSDYLGKQIFAYPIDELDKHGIKFCFHCDKPSNNNPHKPISYPISYKKYLEKFNHIYEYIKSGDTYLLNFTQPTQIETSLSLDEIYESAHGLYKCKIADKFVCFSPEPFISIIDNKIETFPMKGTISSDVKDAKNVLLNNPKELAEHTMVVDLLRNDLSKVAKKVVVERFRYISEIPLESHTIYQTSSHISGTLDSNWRENISHILKELLPAGSISGTPKKRTIEIIDEIEGYDRDFYTGIFGYFDGVNLYSAVAIRYIQKDGDKLIYKSGGGITADSNPLDEYNEMIDKIYIP